MANPSKAQLQAYEKLVTGAALWLSRSRGLALSASVLANACNNRTAVPRLEGKPSDSMQPVVLMLWGLALETALKAILTHRLIEGGSSPGDVAKQLKDHSHRVTELWKSCGLGAEQILLAHLSTLESFVFWAGKYPAPSKPVHVPTVEAPLTSSSFLSIHRAAAQIHRKLEGIATSEKKATKRALDLKRQASVA